MEKRHCILHIFSIFTASSSYFGCSVAKSCPTLRDLHGFNTSGLSVPHKISWSLPKFMSTESVMLCNHLILCCPLHHLLSIFPSIRIFSSELAACVRWPKYWSFSISPSSEYSGLISLRIDRFDLLAVQGTLHSLP